jgi:hypothetical protein
VNTVSKDDSGLIINNVGLINVDIDPGNKEETLYRLRGGQTVTIPYDQVVYMVESKDQSVEAIQYLGGDLLQNVKYSSSYYTSQNDRSVVQIQCVSPTFPNGGTLEFDLVGTKTGKGSLPPGTKVITLGEEGEGGDTPPIVDPDPEEPDQTKLCEKPTIDCRNGEVSFSCATSGVTFHYTITTARINGNSSSSKMDLSQTPLKLKIVAIASKDGYIDSEEAVAEFPLFGFKSVKGDLTGDGVVNDADRTELTRIIMDQGQ